MRKRHFIFTLFAILLLSLVICSPTFAEDDILINDFEADDYGDWTTEGEAFGTKPAGGSFGGQMQVTGFEGEGLVNTFLGGDRPKGKLTSPEFTIERDFITFLIGGGGHVGETCMNLIIDGEVVLSTTGPNKVSGGSEFLNWENWDVSELKGKKAIIEIVDNASGGWGHVNVDQISQSDTEKEKKPFVVPPRREAAPPPMENAQELELTGKYIIFPVTNSGSRGRMTVVINDQLVHNLDCNFPKNADEIDWWTYLDVSEFVGETAKIVAQAEPEICEMFESSDEIRHIQPLYNEAFRPQFHISQMRGWNNDPNGMCYYDGEYHFFWQCNPAGRAWGNMYWGHATSPDMVNWTEQPRVLRSFGGDVENRHPAMADRNCFSGSGNVDHNNSGGWQTGDEKTIILAFTDTGCGEALAYSNDRGQTFTYYENNPVITHRGRDPKLMWYEPGQHWVIAVYDEDENEEIGRNIAIYTSTDLKEWELQSKIPGYFECAEIFELPIDGDPNNTKWVIFAADAQYAFGTFDGKTFTPEHEGKHRVHWGSYYASQCFSNGPDSRVVQVGWARIDIPDMPFNQTFTVPTNLTLHTTEAGVRMFATPIKELEQLRGPDPVTIEGLDLTADEPTVSCDVENQLFDIEVTLKQGTASKAVLQFGGNRMTYDFNSQKLDEMTLPLADGKVTIRLLVDRPMYELIGGGGFCYKTSARADMGEDLGTISLTAEGGTLEVESLKIFEMSSIWPK